MVVLAIRPTDQPGRGDGLRGEPLEAEAEAVRQLETAGGSG
jgi:hypothetical protein